MAKRKTNIAASVRRRLLDLARARRADFQLILIQYAVERLLYRLSQSAYKDRFILKGAMLFSVWSKEPLRVTRDLDLLGKGDNAVLNLEEVFRNICTTPVEKDGLEFLADSMEGEEIREEQEYQGVRLTFGARLDAAQIPLQVDIGFGDAVTPAAQEIDYPVMLDFPQPRLTAYPMEVVIAEKFQSMVAIGIANSRMKDFFDIWILATFFEFQGDRLREAIDATFNQRRTPLPSSPPLALTSEFYSDAGKQSQWDAFLRKGRFSLDSANLDDVIKLVGDFLMPPTLASVEGKKFDDHWSPGGPWQ